MSNILKISLCLLIASLPGVMANCAVVVDSILGLPLPKASIFDKKGNLVGICSDDGVVPDIPLSHYPITITCLGYEDAVAVRPSDRKIALKEAAYDLPEVVVKSGKREVLHLLGYVREYSTLTTYTDTVFLFREKAIDFMVPSKSVKKYHGWTMPRVLASKSYYHFSNYEGLDSVSDFFNQHFSWSDWVGIVSAVNLPPKLLRNNMATDTVFGRYGAVSIWKRNNSDISLDVDALADTVNHKWTSKLSSFLSDKVQFNKFNLKYTFSDVEESAILADNFSMMSVSIESTGKGRNLLRLFNSYDKVDVNTYAEIYITDKKYISKSEARKWENNPADMDKIELRPPTYVSALQPSVQTIVDRVNTIDHTQLRIDKEPDRRYISTRKPHRTGILGLLKSVLKK